MTNHGSDVPRQPLVGVAILIAPVLVLLYGVVRLLDSGHGPGAVWTVSHALLLAGFAAYAIAVPGLRRLVDRSTRGNRVAVDVVAGVTMVGLGCAIGQTVSDIVVGLRAADRAEMSALFGQIHDVPILGPAIGSVGPLLFFIGLPALVAVLAIARPRRVPAWSPVLVTVGTMLPMVTLDLLPLTGALMWLALARPGWRLLDRARSPQPSFVSIRASASE